MRLNNSQSRSSYVSQLSTDGFPAYAEAVDLAFGGHARYDQCVRDYRSNNMGHYYVPPEVVEIESRSSAYGKARPRRDAPRTSNGTTSQFEP